MFNVESVEAGERVEQLASRRKVEFESIDFNKRFLATVPKRVRPDRAARAVQPRVPRLGLEHPQRDRLRDHRPPALLPLAARRPQRGRVRDRARQRGQPLRAPAPRDGGEQPPRLSGRPVARGARAVPAGLAMDRGARDRRRTDYPRAPPRAGEARDRGAAPPQGVRAGRRGKAAPAPKRQGRLPEGEARRARAIRARALTRSVVEPEGAP